MSSLWVYFLSLENGKDNSLNIYHMSCNVDAARLKVEVFITMVVFAITDENKRFGTRREFVGVVGLEIWPTFTAKNL